MNSEFFGRWSAGVLERVEQSLDAWVPASAPAGLGEAMRYAVLDGGKRLRALLVQAAAEAVDAPAVVGGNDAAMRAACAVELIHAYSLVHDDMPCMDNDVLRRGKPTVHIRFGEAQAMLAGDAMQALAFEVLTPDVAPGDGHVAAAAVQAQLCRLLARASGQSGMAGGQAIDLAAVGRTLSAGEIEARKSVMGVAENSATLRAWEYWACRCGCGHLLPGGGPKAGA